MAFSSSVKRSQHILVCGLCDVNTKVKVKCMDCDLYLCDNCEERHSRFKHSDSHSVLPLRDIHLHKDEEEEEFKPVKCKNHKKQFCSIFCRTCDHLICQICNVEAHQKHTLEKIEIMCKRKYEELKEFGNYAERKGQIYLQKLHENKNSKYSEIEKILESKIKAIQELHTRHAEKLHEIKEIKKQSSHHISETEDRISNEEKGIQKNIKEMEEFLESKNTDKFLDVANIIQTKMKTFSGTLKPNEQKMGILQNISGDYCSLVSMFTDTKIELTKLESFPTGSISMGSITSNQMQSVWIANYIGKHIQHLELKNDIKIMETHEFLEGQISEIRCFNGNEILLAISTKIFRMTADGKFRIFKDFSPSKIFTLHVTKKLDIVVGMNIYRIDNKQDIPVIIILGKDGQTKSQYRNSGRQLLKNDIVRCCTAHDGDAICYIDSVYGTRPIYGRLVDLNKSGDIQWTYNGNSTINTEHHSFTPIEVITTKNNNIIASNVDQSALHILTSTGSLLTILDLTLLGIKTPGVVALVSNHFLWMAGSDNDDNSVLFKLEISGV